MSNGKTTGEPSPEATETLLSHLIELRDRILRMFLAILVVFLMLFPFANQIYTLPRDPADGAPPRGHQHDRDRGRGALPDPVQAGPAAGGGLTIPYTLYQLWAFIAPGLYKHEKKMAGPLVASSTILFYLGMAFAYFVVFPLIFAFFTATAPEGVAVMTDISRYLDFVIMLFIAFGIAFEVPIATILLVQMGATTPQKLASKRPYVIVGTFVIGMILTPPDIISQTLLALPMWILFEIGLILSRIMEKRKAERRAAEGIDDDADGDGPDDDPRRGGPAAGPRRGGPGSGGKTPRSGAGGTTPRPATSGSATASGTAAATAGASAKASTATSEFRPLSPDEMDAELDRLEEEERLLAQKRAQKEGQSDQPADSDAANTESATPPKKD